jgi:hypothetical protein
MLEFDRLASKFGVAAAYELLRQIEAAAGIASSAVGEINPEVRLWQAVKAQDSTLPSTPNVGAWND